MTPGLWAPLHREAPSSICRRLCTPSSFTEENKDSPSLLFLKAPQVYLWRGNLSAQIIRVPLETSQQIMKNSEKPAAEDHSGDADGGAESGGVVRKPSIQAQQPAPARASGVFGTLTRLVTQHPDENQPRSRPCRCMSETKTLGETQAGSGIWVQAQLRLQAEVLTCLRLKGRGFRDQTR